jgi:hypothetical protein
VNSDGITTSLYDPDANVVHYFKPKRKTLDASRADGTVHFEPLQETKTVLGHECKALRQSWANISVVVYYDLGIFVDPKPYAHTMLAHMGEGLAVRNGALKLASTLELANETIYAEATSLSQRSFEPSFWSLANNEPIAEADAGPATSAPE